MVVIRYRSRFVSIGSLVGVVIGILLGKFAYSGADWLASGVPVAEWFAKTWIAVLITLALPLVVSHLLVSLLAMWETRLTGRLVVRGLTIHVIMLVVAALFSTCAGYMMTQEVPRGAWSLQGTTEEMTSTSGFQLFTHWAGLVQVRMAQFIIPAILLTVLISVVVYYSPSGIKNPAKEFAAVCSKKLFRALGLLFIALPFSAGSLAFVISFKNQTLIAGMAGFYVIGVCSVLLAFILIQYAAVYFFGGNTLSQFGKAMLPAQLVAANTCSSLATLPALLSSAKRLSTQDKITGATVPLFVSFFRINLMVGNPFSFFLLSRLYDLPLEWSNLGLFLGLMMLTSFGSPGLPQTGNVYSLPVFLAAGIPLEGVVLIKALDAIPDIFKTVLNVTEIGTVTSITLRGVNPSSVKSTGFSQELHQP